MEPKTSTVDAAEVEQFSKIASEWWNPKGKFKPLHDINPHRIEWILERLAVCSSQFAEDANNPPTANRQPLTLKGLRLLDIGCGGGLMCEPFARLGAQVTGIDASEKNISVAKLHAEQSGLRIDYRCTTAEAHDTSGYDVIFALEIIEHVADVPLFVESCCKLLKPGGLIFISTINRTPMSYVKAIIGAEYVLRLLPRGTHDWNKFLRPSEIERELSKHSVDVVEMSGMVLNPLKWEWYWNPKDLSVNYMMMSRKSS
ncbi:MAG: bifunctional 2-polyprenyl-6-hydroxyphenol methylase/3-demethylubiquinol 3-O-methyltransferase UbiG [Rickettsiales bacterium]|jgi:2-polyprenyl-6-hydroxyphenyl methylase/3-demethylubiquinone-9 3-methyltransferase|nr:bifunctional 2-polyprenyl-6-hydroxyphenol methylase/3-demethylubiquinol 3-O-methyltransferase UbiG [Rickettsiales bacterium]